MTSPPRPPDDAGQDAFPAGPVIWVRGDPGAAGAPADPANPVRAADRTAWSQPPVDVLSQGRSWHWPGGRRAWFWYGGTAGLMLVVGLVAVLVMLTTGDLGSGRGPLAARSQPQATATAPAPPPLALRCPPPSGAVVPPTSAPAAPGPAISGPRTVDPDAGISYLAYGAPWQPWQSLWRAGTLEVPYQVGQHFVTETYSGGDYHASILSAAVPASLNDSTAIDLDCLGRQVLADARAEYYPQPNRMRTLREGLTWLGGRPAWVAKARLWFDQDDLRAKSELVGLALIDVGRPAAAVLYVSIPDTHPQWERAVDEVLASVRPT
ncbi:MAG TPA: hypothetical protein VF163_17935 [Micromonosporaceae bacterium]